MTRDSLLFRLSINLIIFFAVLILGTLIFASLEHWSFLNAFYYVIVTIATVGYGDIHPTTSIGKVFAILLIITGVGTFLGVIANTTELMLSRREKWIRMKKLNMLIGVFFSEVGNRLIRLFVDSDPHAEDIRRGLEINDQWTSRDFQNVREHLKRFPYSIEISKTQLEALKGFLSGQRDFFARLLENPVLMEHESFTDLLQAVFHLTEELAYREDLGQIPESDQNHLKGDMIRIYQLLIQEWIVYLEYLKDNYPYLFSLAMRINPFNPQASPIVKKESSILSIHG